jgi:hypothetical protein
MPEKNESSRKEPPTVEAPISYQAGEDVEKAFGGGLRSYERKAVQDHERRVQSWYDSLSKFSE